MATYFIKTGGSDVADGLSAANAWASISKLNASTFSPGDVIMFRAGDTFTGQIYEPSLNGCTVTSYDNATGLIAASGTRAILQNTTPDTVFGSPTGVNNLTIKNLELKTNQATSGAGQVSIIANDSGAVCTNWLIEDCVIHQCGGSGIRISNTLSTAWTIRNCRIYDVGDNGVLLNDCGSGHIIENCTIYNTGGFNASQGRHGIYASCGSYSIRNNEFYNNVNGQAISMRNKGANSSGVAYGNYIHDTGYGIGLFSNGDTNTGTLKAYSNRMYAITGWGIYVGDGSTTYFEVILANNTISLSAGALGIDCGDMLHASAVVKNNIVSGGANAFYGKNASLDIGMSITENYNCFYGQSSGTPFKWNGTSYSFANYKATSGQGANSITTNPLLGPPPQLVLSDASPCIDAGTNSVKGIVFTAA